MQYTRGEPKDFNGLGGKKSLAAEWDRWIADREGGGSMRTARELSQRRRGLRHFGANGRIRSRGRRVLSADSLRELQLRRTARNRAWLIAMAMVSTFAGSAQAQEDASKPNAATSCTAPLQLRMHSRIPGRSSGQRAGRYPAEALDLWRDEMLDLYTRYGAEKISDAVIATVISCAATACKATGRRSRTRRGS